MALKPYIGPKKTWCGKIENCDICGGTLGSVMYDAPTKHGSWGNIGHCCYKNHARPNQGQKYKWDKATKEWIKTHG